MRINITGNAGAGKTTLANQLAEALDLPVFSLDAIVWQPGWKKTPPEERKALEEELVSKPSWVIDGVSSQVRQASDLVIFLDVSRRVCTWRGVKRSLRYFNRTRPSLPPNCPEWRIIPRLLRIIWRFPSRGGMAIRKEATKHPDQYRILAHPNELKAIVEELRHHCTVFNSDSQ